MTIQDLIKADKTWERLLYAEKALKQAQIELNQAKEEYNNLWTEVIKELREK